MNKLNELIINWYKIERLPKASQQYVPPTLSSNTVFYLQSETSRLNFAYLVDSKNNNEIEKLTKDIFGNFLLIEIALMDDNYTFYLLINFDWIEKQVKLPKSLPILSMSIENVLNRWKKNNNRLISSKNYFLAKYQENMYGSLLVNAYFFDFLYHFIQEIEVEVQGRDGAFFKKNDINKVKEVSENSLKNISLPVPSVNELAMSAGMSTSKFKIIFKEIYGIGPHQYFLDQKLAYAHSLYKSGQYNLTQIAYKIGYNHTSSFTRIYKKKYHGEYDSI